MSDALSRPERTPEQEASLALYRHLKTGKPPQWELVRQLETQGADLSKIFFRHFRDQDTALHELAASGSLEAIAYALEKGLDPNALSRANVTPLHSLAARTQHEDVSEAVRLMISYGADPTLQMGSTDSDAPFRRESTLEIMCRASDGHMNHSIGSLLDAGVPIDASSMQRVQRWAVRFKVAHPWGQEREARWERARDFAKSLSPDVGTLTPQMICDLATVEALGVLGNLSLWRGH